MVPATVPSRILFFAMSAHKLATFCSFFGLGVQKCSRTVFTRGDVLFKIAFFRRNIVTVYARELLLATFGYFWVQKLIV
jgi:fatty acid desaturase